MEKKIKYKTYNFIMEVMMNFKVEKHLNGKRYHRITGVCGELQYFATKEVEDSLLTKGVEKVEGDFKKFVDDLGKEKIDPRLAILGFK